MELKAYEKYWLPAIKGMFLIIFGVIGLLKIYGSIQTLAVFFVFLIGMIAFLSIGTGVFYKKYKFRVWTIVSGAMNLMFSLYLISQIEERSGTIEVIRMKITWGIILWTLFYSITEFIEAGILFHSKNAFGALFVINALLTLLFSYALYVLASNFSFEKVTYISLIALVFGIANILSSYLLSIKKEAIE
jgi:hypothetical protein